MMLCNGDLTANANWAVAETIRAQAFSTSGSIRAASDSMVRGERVDGNCRFFAVTAVSMESIESWIIFESALSSESVSRPFSLVTTLQVSMRAELDKNEDIRKRHSWGAVRERRLEKTDSRH